MNRREFTALAAGIAFTDKPIPSLKPKYRKELLSALDIYIKEAVDHREMALFQFLCAVHRAVRRGKEHEAFDLLTAWAFADVQKEARGD